MGYRRGKDFFWMTGYKKTALGQALLDKLP